MTIGVNSNDAARQKLINDLNNVVPIENTNRLSSLPTEALLGGVAMPVGFTTIGSIWNACKKEAKGKRLDAFKKPWKRVQTPPPAAAATNAARVTANTAANASKGAKALKFIGKGIKGNALFAVISGAMEAPDVISAYKTDTKMGNKQLAKSATKVAVGVAGFAAGSALAGAALGAAVGTAVCPVVGTIVGAVGGIVVGALAEWGAGKLWDWKFGKDDFEKSETQIAAEDNAKKMNKYCSNEQIAQYSAQDLYERKIIDENGTYIGKTEDDAVAYNQFKEFTENIAANPSAGSQNKLRHSLFDKIYV